MKFDEKTGKKKAESRLDEIKIAFEEIDKMMQKSDGVMDKRIESNWLLRNLNISMALAVDILGMIYQKLPEPEEKKEPVQ